VLSTPLFKLSHVVDKYRFLASLRVFKLAVKMRAAALMAVARANLSCAMGMLALQSAVGSL
jgi:hypothetical protein